MLGMGQVRIQKSTGLSSAVIANIVQTADHTYTRYQEIIEPGPRDILVDLEIDFQPSDILTWRYLKLDKLDLEIFQKTQRF